ncbi:TPA: ABC-F family ATP-binding cassette domain-containing protein, partial [Streptococcus equi subsp. equi]|nr:ABC-F family ATP-binding cassette domain-containing protein [Streptococcus equi subsp. equi]
LGAFLFSGEDVKKSVAMLSGGEKARLLLTKLSMKKDNFLILDEPTNHLDIDSKEVLENALIDFDGTLLFVSHDRYFINRVATKVLEITEAGSTLYLGDYDYYVEKKAEREELARLAAADHVVETDVAEAAVTDYQLQKASQKEYRRLTRRFEEIEQTLEGLEAQAKAIEAQMLVSNDTTQLIDWQKELDQLNQKQETLLLEWEDIAGQLE